MPKITDFNDSLIIQHIKDGAVGVIPTETLYGLVASASQPKAVERVYELKRREASKPCIILIDKPERALDFGIPAEELALVRHYWPAPLSVIFSRLDDKFGYLRRELGNPPFRVPDSVELRTFLTKTGPLIAPSANKEGETPVADMTEIQEAFGTTIDFAIDGGQLTGAPSTLIKMQPNGTFTIIRQGVFQLTR